MQYEDILKKIEQDEKNAQRTDIFRYNGLLEAIDFFSNRLTLDQITDTAFDFVNELLTVKKSVMYIFEDDRYIVQKERGIKSGFREISMSAELSSFALYVGNVVSGKAALMQLFDETLLNALSASVMLPLILEDKLYGFLFLSERITAPFDDNDILMCETLMKLFNNSMESCKRIERLQASNSELDEKIFNLFAINQSAKAMLAEHRLNELHSLAVDVFSELTQSANTGFILYDEHSEKYCLKAYRDVFNPLDSVNIQLSLKPDSQQKPERKILDLCDSENASFFSSLFEEDADILSEINANYAVLIYGQKNQILGFVTLGRTISGSPYKKSTFELVESLAAYTCIALTNAMLISIVNEQKLLLQKKLDRLNTLNRLSKNINSALDSTSLTDLALETLTVSFGVESALVTLYDNERSTLRVVSSSDPSLTGIGLPLNTCLEPLKSGRIIYEPTTENLPSLVGDEIADSIRNNSGVLAIPMTLEHYETLFIGAILIFKLKEGLLSDEENILTFETVANQIAPLIEGFRELETQKNLFKKDMAHVFSLELEQQVKECEMYDLDMEIIRVLDTKASPYSVSDVSAILSMLISGVYPVSYCHTEIIITRDFEYNHHIIAGALADKNVVARRSRYKKDFTCSRDYLALKE